MLHKRLLLLYLTLTLGCAAPFTESNPRQPEQHAAELALTTRNLSYIDLPSSYSDADAALGEACPDYIFTSREAYASLLGATALLTGAILLRREEVSGETRMYHLGKVSLDLTAPEIRKHLLSLCRNADIQDSPDEKDHVLTGREAQRMLKGVIEYLVLQQQKGTF